VFSTRFVHFMLKGAVPHGITITGFHRDLGEAEGALRKQITLSS
jgi:hypothetical protein